MPTIYHNPRCSKSREALALLKEAGYEPEIIDYQKTLLSLEELNGVLEKLNLEPQQVFRTKESLYKELGLKDRELTREEACEILIQHPKLMERPIVVHQEKAIVARPPERISELF